MTARRFPDDPRFGSAAEEHLVETLQEQLPDDAVLFCNLRFSDGREDREADLIVAWPGVGVAVEIQGGAVSLQRGEWRQVGDGVDRVIHPVDQAACRDRSASARIVQGLFSGFSRDSASRRPA